MSSTGNIRTITCRASEQRVTCVKFNSQGDLLFTSGADGLVSVWRTADGERLGTYHHIKDAPYDWTLENLRSELQRPPKAVSHIDVNRQSTMLAVCRFDSVLIFDVQSGKLLDVIVEETKVECCEWCQDPEGSNKILIGVTDIAGPEGSKPSFKIYECDDLEHPDKFKGGRTWKVVNQFSSFEGGNPVVCAWGPLDKYVIGGMEQGKLYMWEIATGKVVHMRNAHQTTLTCLSFNKCRSVLLTASIDKTAKLWSVMSFSVIREITVDRPLCACSLNPLFDHPDEKKRVRTMILAGGQRASEVTTTSASEGYFEILIVDTVSGEEVNRALIHYSPTVCLSWHPTGHIFATGAYEGNSKIVFLAA